MIREFNILHALQSFSAPSSPSQDQNSLGGASFFDEPRSTATPTEVPGLKTHQGSQATGWLLGSGSLLGIGGIAVGTSVKLAPAWSAIAAEGLATASTLIALKASLISLAIVGGFAIGTGINFLPKAFGAEKTVGDHIGDWMTSTFGPADLNGNFFKVCEFLGLA